jgi:hypothetical protein
LGGTVQELSSRVVPIAPDPTVVIPQQSSVLA